MKLYSKHQLFVFRTQVKVIDGSGCNRSVCEQQKQQWFDQLTPFTMIGLIVSYESLNFFEDTAYMKEVYSLQFTVHRGSQDSSCENQRK